MPLFVSGLCSAPRRGRPGRPPLPWTEELGSSPGSLWFLATAPHGSRRRRAAEGAAKNAAEVGQVTAGGRETTDPAARARAHAPGAWHHQPACRGPTCLTRAGESDPGTRRRAPCPCRGRQGLGRRASEAAKWRPVCAASWLPGHWGLHARGGGTRAGRRRAGRLPTCMRNHVRARADAAAWPCRAPKGRGAPAGLRARRKWGGWMDGLGDRLPSWVLRFTWTVRARRRVDVESTGASRFQVISNYVRPHSKVI